MKTIIIEKKFLEYLKLDKKLYDKYKKLSDFSFNYYGIVDFSIYIGENISEKYYNLQYILQDSHESFDERIEFVNGPNALRNALMSAYFDIIASHKKILLYLGKFPGYGNDIDGGSILAKQLIDTLKIRCNLDIAFIRKNKEIYYDEFVKNIYYYDYKDAQNNKFIRRLENIDTNTDALRNFQKYDKIITAHVSKFFVSQLGDEFWRKTILFPMFCTHSYIRAGEYVPQEYTNLEKEVIKKVTKIITPSNEEKLDLVNEYKVNENKITVIYRGISEHIKFKVRTLIGKQINIIAIGSIKKQKNNLMQLQILNKLIESNINAKLHIVTTIQDEVIYKELKEYILNNNLSLFVEFHFSISQIELAELLDKCDINISTSNWETFGRGVFEGIGAGLPTLVNDKLLVVKNIVTNNYGVKFLKTVDDFYYEIIKMLNSDYYKKCSNALTELLDNISYKSEQIKLVEEILR